MTGSPEEVTAPCATNAGVARPEPTHCDVCHRVLDVSDEYHSMSIIRDATPRRLRVTSGGGFIEDEWRLEVCAECNGRFELWLFGDPHEADTIPAPPRDGVELPVLGADLGVEAALASNAAGGAGYVDDESESAPFASVPPNRS